MTEAEWLSANDPCLLLARLHRLPGDRKLWLYGVACCRAHWGLLTQPASREAVEWVERYADGEAQRDEVYDRLEYKSEGAAFRLESQQQQQRTADWVEEHGAGVSDLRGQLPDLSPILRVTAAYFANALLTLDSHDPYDPTLSSYRALLLEEPLRDIFGNPSRTVTFSPEWRTDTVLALARQMYEARDFGAMPILADALQDAGCDSDDLLNHCRDPQQVHVRGCWAVDLVLGKA